MQKAIGCYEQQLAITREIGDRLGEGLASHNLAGDPVGGLGRAHGILGETREAVEFCARWLTIAREIGDRHGEGTALGNLGNGYLDLGEPRRAIKYYEQVLTIVREIRNRLARLRVHGTSRTEQKDRLENKSTHPVHERAHRVPVAGV